MRIPVRALLALVATLVPFAGPVTPAHAEYSGAVVFQGAVTLSTFPCSRFAPCPANFNASLAAGSLAGRGGGGIVTGLHASFDYWQECNIGIGLLGGAVGRATFTGVNGWGTLLPATADFAWFRVGLVAVITSPVVTDQPVALAGAALFVPTGGLPTCTGGSVTATVMGAVTAAGA